MQNGSGVVLSSAVDPLASLRARRRQMLALARYGRQSVLQWDDMEITEFHAWHTELVALLNEENPDTPEDT